MEHQVLTTADIGQLFVGGQPKAIYSGNISYVKSPTAKPETEYFTMVTRYRDDSKIEERVVGVFVPTGTLEALGANVGDLVCARARNIIQGNTALADGTPVHRFAGLDQAFSINMVARKALVVEDVLEDGDLAQEQPGIMTRLGELFQKLPFLR